MKIKWSHVSWPNYLYNGNAYIHIVFLLHIKVFIYSCMTSVLYTWYLYQVVYTYNNNIKSTLCAWHTAIWYPLCTKTQYLMNHNMSFQNSEQLMVFIWTWTLGVYLHTPVWHQVCTHGIYAIRELVTSHNDGIKLTLCTWHILTMIK